MKQNNDTWLAEAVALAERDSWHRQCTRELESMEPAFQRILDGLSPEDRETLSGYLLARDAVHYSLVCAAYAAGQGHKKLPTD